MGGRKDGYKDDARMQKGMQHHPSHGPWARATPGHATPPYQTMAAEVHPRLSLIHISEPTRLALI
eukprot:5531330-Alexandrium_andersonii.AAC.1